MIQTVVSCKLKVKQKGSIKQIAWMTSKSKSERNQERNDDQVEIFMVDFDFAGSVQCGSSDVRTYGRTKTRRC